MIPDFITLAEAKLKRDDRVVLPTLVSLNVSAATYTLPTDFKRIISLWGDATALRGPIEIVPAEKLVEYKAAHDTTGAPVLAAIYNDRLNFAPTPQTSYTLSMLYDATVTPLSDSVSTNWLLTNHPDVYLYSALVESAPYLKEDERIPVWEAQRERGIQEIVKQAENKRWGGRLVIRPRQVIGEGV